MVTHLFRNSRRAAGQAADAHIALLHLPADTAQLPKEKIGILLRHAVVAGFEAALKWRAADPVHST